VVQPLPEERAVQGTGRLVDNRSSIPTMDDKTSLGRGLMLTGVTEAATEMRERAAKSLLRCLCWALACFRWLLWPGKGSETALGSDPAVPLPHVPLRDVLGQPRCWEPQQGQQQGVAHVTAAPRHNLSVAPLPFALPLRLAPKGVFPGLLSVGRAGVRQCWHWQRPGSPWHLALPRPDPGKKQQQTC